MLTCRLGRAVVVDPPGGRSGRPLLRRDRGGRESCNKLLIATERTAGHNAASRAAPSACGSARHNPVLIGVNEDALGRCKHGADSRQPD